jgi:TfoX/Sxy family transcriptional regulator of competence genes
MTATADAAQSEALFETVVQAHTVDAGVTKAKMFGSEGLRTGGKVFACLWKGNLVVKLPAARVEALVSAGKAGRFDPGMGRQMKEWVEIAPSRSADWLTLAAESRAFVESLR